MLNTRCLFESGCLLDHLIRYYYLVVILSEFLASFSYIISNVFCFDRKMFWSVNSTKDLIDTFQEHVSSVNNILKAIGLLKILFQVCDKVTYCSA